MDELKQGVDLSAQKIKRESLLLGSSLREWWVVTLFKPLEDFCIRKNITPNQLTLFASFLYIILFALYATNHVLTAGWFAFLVGSFDFLDGRVARATNKVTKSGAFLDSVMDRYQDTMFLAGIAVLYRDSWVLYFVLAAILGSNLVPYARSKATEFQIDLSDVGSMQRPERFFLVSAGSVISSLIQISMMPFYGPGNKPPQFVLILVIVVLAFSTNWTAYRRIRYTLDKLDASQR